MDPSPERLLDVALPQWDFAERHARLVHASPAVVWQALQEASMRDQEHVLHRVVDARIGDAELPHAPPDELEVGLVQRVEIHGAPRGRKDGRDERVMDLGGACRHRRASPKSSGRRRRTPSLTRRMGANRPDFAGCPRWRRDTAGDRDPGARHGPAREARVRGLLARDPLGSGLIRHELLVPALRAEGRRG